MNYYRGNAIAVGVLLIACTASSILSAIPLSSTLESPDYLSNLAVNSNRVIVTALMEFVWAATGAGIAIGMYPILRKYNAALALGSATGRIVEGVFVLIGTLSLLVLLSVSERSLMAGSAAPYQATGDALLAVREWVHGFLIFLPFLVGALTYYYMLYRSRLVPRWLSAWGLVGAALSLGATVYCGFRPGLRLHDAQYCAEHPNSTPGDGFRCVADRQGVQSLNSAFAAIYRNTST